MFNTMSAYLDSNKIKVFPCGGRNINYDPLARLTTEQNLVSIINRLVDMDSFIVTTHASNQEMDDSIEEYIFNINGYLFTVPNGVGAKTIIETTLNAFTNNGNTKLTEGTPYYLLAHIRKETYQGVTNDSVLMTYTQLSLLSKTYPDPTPSNTTTSYIEISIPKSNMLEAVEDVPGVYKYGNQYVKEKNDKYYECDVKGNYILLLASEYYKNNETGRNDILDQQNLDDKSLFNGLEFIITPKSKLSNYSNTTIDKYLILFEYKWNIKIDTDGKYYLDNDSYKTPVPSDYTGIKYSITAGKWYEYEDSKVKFKTTTNGLQRSVTIDDGELN